MWNLEKLMTKLGKKITNFIGLRITKKRKIGKRSTLMKKILPPISLRRNCFCGYITRMTNYLRRRVLSSLGHKWISFSHWSRLRLRVIRFKLTCCLMKLKEWSKKGRTDSSTDQTEYTLLLRLEILPSCKC